MKYILDASILQSILANMEPDKRGDYIMKAANFLSADLGANKWAKHIPKPKSKEAIGEYTPDFEIFWGHYPKKIGKGSAFEVWKKIIKKEEALEFYCQQALHWQKPLWAKDDNKYVPNPENYLKGRRWEDEPPATQAKRETYMDMNGVMRER